METFGVISTHRVAMQSQFNTKQTADNHKRPEKDWNLRSSSSRAKPHVPLTFWRRNYFLILAHPVYKK